MSATSDNHCLFNLRWVYMAIVFNTPSEVRMYIIKVRHANGFAFEVECTSVEHARLVETEFMKRFSAFEGYAVGAYVIERTTRAVCL